MTLKTYHSDMLNNNNFIGIKEIDPQNDKLFRNKIIQKLDYLIKTSKEPNTIQAYSFCKEEIDKRSKKIEEITKEIESKIAEQAIMLNQTKENNKDENIYNQAIKAYELFLTYIKDRQ